MNRRLFGIGFSSVLASTLGCLSGTTATVCGVTITQLNGESVDGTVAIGEADDQSAEIDGIQVSLTVEAVALEDGSQVTISGGKDATTVTLEGGSATFTDYTLDDSGSTNTLEAEASGAACDAVGIVVTLPKEKVVDLTCAFVSPDDDAVLTPDSDENAATPDVIDLGVSISSNAPDGSTATLTRDGTTMTAAVASGAATFDVGYECPGDDGDSALSVTVTDDQGNSASCGGRSLRVSCGFEGCDITGFGPTDCPVVGGLGTTCNASHDGNAGLENLQIDVNVNTDSPGATVELDINDDGTYDTDVTADGGGDASLPVTLPQGSSTLRARCTDADNNSVTSFGFPVVVDTISPDDVGDLDCGVVSGQHRSGTVSCTWSTPGDSGGTGVGTYELRYATGMDIDAASFDAAAAVTPAPDPLDTSIQFSGLTLGGSYDFAMRVTDAAGNVGGVSGDIPSFTVDFVTRTIGEIEADDRFGWGIASGDFNCDGTGDAAISANRGGGVDGRVYLFFGTPTGIPAAPTTQIRGSIASGQLGRALASLGDFNGDGCDDLAAGSTEGDSNRGRVNVYLGRPFWFERDETSVGMGADLRVVGPFAFAFFASSVAGPGDVNDDGMNDLAVYGYDEGASTAGDQVEIYYGRSVPLMVTGASPVELTSSGDADIKFQQPQFDSVPFDDYQMGWFQSSLGGGDINGDGYAEVFVGAVTAGTPGSTGPGAVYVLFGADADSVAGPEVISAESGTRAAQITAPADADNFGQVVGLTGDLDGGGAKLVVTDPTRYEPEQWVGRVYGFSPLPGDSGSGDDLADWSIANGASDPRNDRLGFGVPSAQPWSCGGVCDLDGDGMADLVVGASTIATGAGGAYVFFGSGSFGTQDTNAADHLVSGPENSQSFSEAISFISDQNGDGFVDLMVRDIPQDGLGIPGRVFLYE